MADFSKFRTAVSGFNRTDVVNYIESASIEHQKALRKLTDERDRLAGENAGLQTQLEELQAQLQQAKDEAEARSEELQQAKEENESLSEQLNTLAQEGAELAEQLKQAKSALQPEAEAEPDVQPEEPAQADPSVTEKELAAYRRAEQAERNAAVRARRIYAQLSSLCEDARGRYLDSGEEIAALTSDLSTGLSRLQDALADVQVIFDDAQNAFDGMQLPETDDTEE